MEILKNREKPELLTVLELLDKRMTLPLIEKQHLHTMLKGYNGEILFDSLIDKDINTDALVMNDVSLMLGSSPFQIDSIVLTTDTLYLYEVKNYQGTFINRNGQFITSTGQEIENPVNQLNRTTMLLSKLLKKWNVTLPIKSSVVFVHPSFFLYEAKETDSFIFPSQLEDHFTSINRQIGLLTDKHIKLAQRIITESQKELPFQRQLPFYDFEGLKKGLLCGRCGSFDLASTTKKSHCQTCGNKTLVNDLLMDQVKAFRILFPEKLITTNSMYEWCGEVLTKRRISAILNERLERNSYAKSSHYR